MSYEHIKKNFKKKKIDENFDQSINLDNDLESFFRYESEIKENISNLDDNFRKWLRNDKKSDKIIEMLNKEIEEKDNEIYIQEKKLKEKKAKESRVCDKIIEIMDLIENMYVYIEKIDNIDLRIKTYNIYKKINKYLNGIENEIGMEEIDSKMKIMNPELHECVEIKDIEEYNSSRLEEDKVVEDTIIDVVRKGYKLDGKVLRVAKVVVAKDKRIILK